MSSSLYTDNVGRDFGYVALYRGHGAVGHLIRWQTRSEYSHASLVYPDADGLPSNLSIESKEFHGVRRHEITPDEWENIDLFRVVNCTPTQWRRAFQFAERQLGADYDWRGVFRFVTRLPAYKNDKWFCSELVCAALRYAGCPLLSRIACHEVPPGFLRLSNRLVDHA